MTEFAALDLPEMTLSTKDLFSPQNDPLSVSVLLNEFETKGNEPFYSGFVPELLPEQKRTEKFKALGIFMLKVFESFVWEKEKDKARYKEWAWTHAEQRQVLEKAIRILEKAGADPEVMLWMGKAYLYRSRIIRPKGFTIPAKKTESLFKSLDYCLRSLDSKNELAAQAAHYAGLVALELDRCGKPRDNLLKNDYPGKKPARLRDLLNNATAQKPSDTDDRIVGFYQMRIRLEEFEKPLKYDDKSIFNVDKNGLELEKFKVALLLDNEKIDECREALLIQLSRSPFSHHLWEDTVKFIRRLYDEKNPKWKDLAIKLWKKAEAKSIRTTSVHLRWYWSRQRNLYDLAFLAAIEMNNIRLAAEIADSAKSRPALIWQAMERMAVSDDIIKKEIEWNSNVLSKVYIKDFNQRDTDKTKLIPESEFPEKLDTSAIVVQFYLVHLHEDDKKDNAEKHAPAEKDTKHGYALIFDGKEWKYDEKFRFDFKPLWNAYLQWRSAYDRASRKFTSAKDLQSLCLELGKQLRFLFEFENNRQMIFVPHDFLHRLPLHGAMADEKTILLEKFKCTYLPALCYARKSEAPKQGAKSFLLHHLNPDDSNTFNLDELKKCFPEKNVTHFVNHQSVENVFKKNPAFLGVLCHGKSDYVNPFYSKFLSQEPLTLLELAAIKEYISGTGIFLSVCETDLVPPIDSPLDEHLSLASILLNKKASFVLGTMWKLYAFISQADKLVSNIDIINADTLRCLQIFLWWRYKKNRHKDHKDLYHCLGYKLYQYLE